MSSERARGCLGFAGDEKQPSNVGILMNKKKYIIRIPIATSIQWKARVFQGSNDPATIEDFDT